MFFMVKLMLPNVNNQVVKISSVIIIKKYLRPLIRPEVVLLYVTRVKSRNRSSNNIDKRVFQIKQTITVRNSFFFFLLSAPASLQYFVSKTMRKKELNFISSLSLQLLIECAFIIVCKESERAPHIGTGNDNIKPIY